MYTTSTDYGRLWELIQPTEEERENAGTIAIPSSGILYRCRFGEKGERVSAWHELPKAATRWTREGFVADCKKYRREFIDPASQQKTPAEISAGEMYEFINWIRSVQGQYAIIKGKKFLPQILDKAYELLKKARGEA